MKDRLNEDIENMIEIMERTSYRADIWQDRFIYAMARAIYDILKVVRKGLKDV